MPKWAIERVPSCSGPLRYPEHYTATVLVSEHFIQEVLNRLYQKLQNNAACFTVRSISQKYPSLLFLAATQAAAEGGKGRTARQEEEGRLLGRRQS